MASINPITEALSASLASAGFKKKSDSWYWDNSEVIHLVNLQKSQYGGQYYINCAVALKKFGASGFPKEHLCHIRFRLASMVPEMENEKCKVALDLENQSLSNAERKVVISDLFEKYGLTLLRLCSSESGILVAYKDGLLSKAMVHKRVKELKSRGQTP